MLKYLEKVTEDLLMTTVLICLFWSLCRLAFGRKGDRFILAGMILGVIASGVMSWLKNTTSLIATNQWNFYIFLSTIAATLLFSAFSVAFGRRRRQLTYYGSDTDAGIGTGGWLVGITGAVLTILLLFYELPDLLSYPFIFETAGKGVLSAEYFTRLAGYLLALLLIWIYVCLIYKCSLRLNSTRVVLWVMNLTLLANAIRCFGLAVSKWTAHSRWLKWLPDYNSRQYPWAFPLAKFTTNNTLFFILVVVGLSLIIPAALFIRNLKIRAAYSNAAQHRKLKAECRHNRRISVAAVFFLALCVLNLTVVHSLNNQKVELSPPESYEIRGEGENAEIYISTEQVNDGNLHRFEYVTDNRVEVRWIIVKKPGGGSFGVGLDACEVCGTAGYYQRGDQVVCKRCDVVMNINTIGFKGGCNPIPLAFRIDGGYIIFKMSDIIASEKEFK